MIKKIFLIATLVFAFAGCSGSKGRFGSQGFGYSGAGSELDMNAGDRVFFAFDSSSLDSKAQSTLSKQAEWLSQNKDVNATIAGHCDIRGTREYNLGLGERRANAVKQFLVNSGVASGRLKVVSYGKERPAAVGDTEEAHRYNRRAVTELEMN